MSERTFDVIVIGAGPAGEVCAGRAAEHGLSVAIIESHLVGGECSFYGCMPSKALLRAGQLLDEVRRTPGASEAVTGSLDVGAVLARRDEVIHDLRDDSQLPWLENHGIALVRGEARFVGERAVEVNGVRLRARRAVVLAAGTTAAIPPIPGLREAKPWTNREATTAHAVPASLAVIGGGVIGVELGQAYAVLGSSVTIIEAAERVLMNEEPRASELVTQALTRAGVRVLVKQKVTSVERVGGDGDFRVQVEGLDKPVVSEQLLVAVGRTPAIAGLDLERVGVHVERFVDVDDQFRVPDAPWLYAIGDINGRALLTHMGKYQARLVADQLAGHGPTLDQLPGGAPPRVTFTEPQVAAVGYTLAEAKKTGFAVREVTATIAHTAGASFHGRDAAGEASVVIDAHTHRLMGATFIGADVADMLHAATVALTMRATLDHLAHAVPAFPTRSEIWLRLQAAAGL